MKVTKTGIKINTKPNCDYCVVDDGRILEINPNKGSKYIPDVKIDIKENYFYFVNEEDIIIGIDNTEELERNNCKKIIKLISILKNEGQK